MKQFNLEEYLKNPSRKVVTRKGIPVKIHCTNFATNKPVIAEVDGRGYSQSFFKDGRFFEDNYDSSEDLFFAPKKQEGWINIFIDSNNSKYLGTHFFESKEEAEEFGKRWSGYITSIRIE